MGKALVGTLAELVSALAGQLFDPVAVSVAAPPRILIIAGSMVIKKVS